MIKKLKVATVVGTRPEIIRLSAIIKRLSNSKSFEHILIHTGQNYDKELNEFFFDDLDIPTPNFYLDAANESALKTIGNIIIKLDDLLDKISPDVLIILGDTNSCLSALAAKKKKIPIIHLEAGNRCFDQRVPEEVNRKIVDVISDLNLTYSNISREYLLQEGFSRDRVIKIGSPMREVINANMKKIENSKILEKLNLKRDKFFLVSYHREENLETKNFQLLFKALDLIFDKYKLPIVFSTHPRTRKKIKENQQIINPNIQILKPLNFSDYNSLQNNSFITLSDSGTISEESSILNFRAINLRENHERPEAMEETSVIMSGLNIERILQSIELVSNQSKGNKRDFNIVKDYEYFNISLKLERILLSYVDYINRTVWKKEF